MDIKNFVKEHKKELIIGGVAVAITGVGIYLGVSKKSKPTVVKDVVESLNPDKTIVPDLEKFGVDAVYDYGGAIEFMTGFAGTNGEGYPTKVGDIAEIVEILKEKCGVTDLSDVYIMMNIGKTTK